MKKRRWTSAAAQRLLNTTNTDDVGRAVVSITEPLLDGVPCPPTDLDTIAERLGVRIERGEINGSGELHQTTAGLVAMYAAGQGRGRRRFTIAHELAHAVIYATGPRAPRSGRELERLCDMIAVELLMPAGVFSKRLSPDLSPRDVFELAREFQTSLAATAIRCAELSSVTACEVQRTQIIWRRGNLDPATLADPVLRRIMECACAGTTGSDILYLIDRGTSRWYRVQYQPIGSTGRALLLFTRTRDPRLSDSAGE